MYTSEADLLCLWVESGVDKSQTLFFVIIGYVCIEGLIVWGYCDLLSKHISPPYCW